MRRHEGEPVETRSRTMAAAQDHLDQAEVRAFVTALDFVREYAIRLVEVSPGAVTIELPFDDRFSGPPGQFPASMVGTAGDVAAVSSCLHRLGPQGAPLRPAAGHPAQFPDQGISPIVGCHHPRRGIIQYSRGVSRLNREA